MSFHIDCKCKNTTYISRTDSVRAYFTDIRKYDELSQETERELLEKTKSKNKSESIKAMHKLVECNQRFITSIAKKYCNSDNFMDIVLSANEGFIKAINKFDISNKTNRLLTYAVPWIRKYINNYIIYEYKQIRPVNADKVYTYANKIRNSFYLKNERMPTLEEIQYILSNEYNMKISNVEDLEIVTISSIDCPINSKEDNNCDTFGDVGEFAISTSSNNIYEKMDKEDRIERINYYLSNLDDREELILRKYFGFGYEQKSVDDISTELNLTKVRIRQIIDSSIKKLRQIEQKAHVL